MANVSYLITMTDKINYFVLELAENSCFIKTCSTRSEVIIHNWMSLAQHEKLSISISKNDSSVSTFG